MSANALEAIVRTEFGKGAARRTRAAGQVPAVLYGHGNDPQHLALNARDFAKVLRLNGTNAVLSLKIEGKDHLALTKSVVVHPLRNYIEHADLLVIKRGEKVTVDVPVVLVGEPEAGLLVAQDATTISLEADAMKIPESIEVSIEGAEAGTLIVASQLELPAGSTLQSAEDTLIVNITVAPEMPTEDEEAEGEAAEGDEDAEAEGEAAEGDSAESAE